MKIRTRFIIIFLFLSLTPLAIIGVIAYKNGEEAIKDSLGSSFQTIAREAIEMVDRRLNEVFLNVQVWSELEFMQEVITGDLDNKISSFLMGLDKKYGYFSSIDVLNSKGKVVASSNPEMIGQYFGEDDFYRNAFRGRSNVEDVGFNEISKKWVVIFSSPIKAEFEKGEIIGAICAKWKTDELSSMTSAFMKGEDIYYDHIMLLRRDGLVISAPESEKDDLFKRNLIRVGLETASLASQGKEGYLIEMDEHGRKSLIGYSASKGYRDFPGLGWSALVQEDIRIAFEPIERLKFIVFTTGAAVTLFVVIISLISAGRITIPILKISQVATKVAQGNFEERVDFTSGDEIGILAKNFNRMIVDLSTSIQKEKELAAATAAAEVERKRAVELEKAYKKLQEMQDMLIQAEKLNAVGQLASGVAHEVKNPLGIIIQGVDYLGKKLSPKETDSFETLGMIKDSVKRADKIISALLDFSKATKLDLQVEDVNSILESSLTLIMTKVKSEKIAIIKETEKDIPEVLADRTRIEQVFVNLILNAIQAMPEGGKIVIRSYGKVLEEARNGIGRREGDHFRIGEKTVIVEVEDTGTGILKENLKKIFDPFFTTKSPGGGAGLGLSVSRNIITMHKGLIDVESQIGKGTKVIVTLKVA